MEQLLYTPEEAAASLNISRRKVYEMLRDGEIDSVKIGRCRRIPRVALDRFIAQLVEENAA